jgi:hypothetical protein
MPRPRSVLLANVAPVAQWISPLVVSVQRGVITFASALTGTATIQPVNLANAVLTWGGGSNDTADAQAWAARVELTNATTVTAVRMDPFTTTTYLSWEVTEYAPGVIRSVQRGSATITAVPTTVTIAAVSDLAKTSVELLGQTGIAGHGVSTFNYIALQLTSVTSLRADTGSNTSQTFGWQVTEWN